MADTRTTSAGTKTLRVLTALSGHTLNGISNSELAKRLNESPATINRCLNTLIEEGYATKLDSGLFAPGMQLLKVAHRRAKEFTAARQKMDEIEDAISRY